MSPTAKTLIADPRNDVEVSPASYWEIAIKVSLGRYELTEPYRTFIEGEMAVNQFRILHIEPKPLDTRERWARREKAPPVSC